MATTVMALRRTFRDGGKVKNETVANLSVLPGHVIDLIDAGLIGVPIPLTLKLPEHHPANPGKAPGQRRNRLPNQP